MKRIISALLGAAFAVGAYAAPVADASPRPLSQLLGLREVPGASAAFSASGSQAFAPKFSIPRMQSEASGGGKYLWLSSLSRQCNRSMEL